MSWFPCGDSNRYVILVPIVSLVFIPDPNIPTIWQISCVPIYNLAGKTLVTVETSPHRPAHSCLLLSWHFGACELSFSDFCLCQRNILQRFVIGVGLHIANRVNDAHPFNHSSKNRIIAVEAYVVF